MLTEYLIEGDFEFKNANKQKITLLWLQGVWGCGKKFSPKVRDNQEKKNVGFPPSHRKVSLEDCCWVVKNCRYNHLF